MCSIHTSFPHNVWVVRAVIWCLPARGSATSQSVVVSTLYLWCGVFEVTGVTLNGCSVKIVSFTNVLK